MNQRLSSDNLYHFTQDYNTIVRILETGFRYSLCNESIPEKSIYKNIFNVSFCDIRFIDSETHRNCYGDNSIVLSKDWGVRNGISPIRYIHLNSPGLDKSYISIKDHYNLITYLNTVCKKDFYQSYIITSLMTKDNLLDMSNLNSELKSKSFAINYKHVKKKLNNLGLKIKNQSIDNYQYFNNILEVLINQINDLHSELTIRDNFIRLYEDNFECPTTKVKKRKILYDEREWRSIYVFDIEENDLINKTVEVDEFMKQGYLPSNFNLRFTEKDVIAILTKDDISKRKIIDESKNINGLLSYQFIQNHIFTINEFKEE